MKNLYIIAALLLLTGTAFAPSGSFVPEAQAEEGHGHDDHDDHGHDEEEGHGHNDGHAHDDSHGHKEHGDDHSDETEHGHDEGSHDEGDDGHGHGEENSDDGHGHGGHDEHEEEGKTEIAPDAAKKSGIVVSKVSSGTIGDVVSLTGRIRLNLDTTAEIPARFPGIVRSVKAKLGQRVRKGDVLATVESNDSLKVYSIKAPTSGVVLKKNTNVGNVARDEPLFTIANLSNVWAEFHVFPRNLDKVKEGQIVRVHTLENGQESESPITLLLPTADPLSQTVIAIVTIPNKQGKWRPGMTVEGDVYVSEQEVSVAVTEESIQRMEDETVVFVKEGDAYEMRPVKLGKSDGKYVEVIEGLKAGESYVSQGSFIVKADIGKAAAKHEH